MIEEIGRLPARAFLVLKRTNFPNLHMAFADLVSKLRWLNWMS